MTGLLLVWYDRCSYRISQSLSIDISLCQKICGYICYINNTIQSSRFRWHLHQILYIFILKFCQVCVCHRITSTPMKMTFLRRVVKSWYESHCLYPSICVVGTLYPVHHTLRSHLSVIRHSCVCTTYETSREMRTRNIAPPSWHCHLIWSRCSLSLSPALSFSLPLWIFLLHVLI